MIAAREPRRIVFRELMMTMTAALQGKIARLPVVYSLRVPEPSAYDRAQVEPLFAFLEDATTFFSDYSDYRARLIAFARRQPGADPAEKLHDCTIEHFMDLYTASAWSERSIPVH